MLEARATAVQATVVFDFDGTLVRRDSLLDFSVRYCLRRPHRLVMAGLLLPFALVLALRSQRAAGSILLWAITVGSSTRRFVVALREYARLVLPGLANESIFAELVAQQQMGHRVVVATGTVPLLVRQLLRARGLGPLGIVGSRLRGRAGGLVVETHCTGRTKLRELERQLGITSWQAVYTDSFADQALIRAASDVTLVAPDQRTLKRTRHLLGPRVALRVLSPD